MKNNIHPAATAARALAAHADGIAHIIREHGGIVDDSVENAGFIEKLQRAALGYSDTDMGGLVLHGAVVRFVRHYDERLRFRESSGNIAAMIKKITDSGEMHRMAEEKQSPDRDIFRRELMADIGQLSEALLAICRRFAAQIYEEMAGIADLTVRIRFNEMQLDELKRLNDILGGLLAESALREIGGGDSEVKALLQRILLPARDKCLLETAAAANRLNAELLRWKKDLQNRRDNALVDAFLRRCRQVPRYRPDDGFLPSAPQCFYRAELALHAYADWQGMDDEDVYTRLAARAAKSRIRPQTNAPEPRPAEVRDCRTQTVEEEPSHFANCLQWFFQALQAEDGYTSLNAREAYEDFRVQADMETWLMALSNYYHKHKEHFKIPLSIGYESESPPLYNGNRLVFDLTVARIP